MSEPRTLLIEVANVVGLADDIEMLEALGELAANWARLARELPNFASALALARAIADGATDEAVTNAFAAAGAQPLLAKLQNAAAKLKAQLDEIPEEIVRLLQPISTFDEQVTGSRDSGLVRWTILDKETTPLAESGSAEQPSYSLSLGARAALTLEAGDSWPYSDRMPAPLLRLRADGGLKAKAAATLPFKIGKAEFGAEATAACALEYYFAVSDPATVYAAAVAGRLGKLPDPFDFDALWDAFSSTDLAGVHYEFDGSTKVNVAVSLADVTALGAGVDVSLGAKVGVGLTLGGKYFLTFRKARGVDGTPQIIAALSRQRSRGGSLSAEIGVTVDFASLAEQVHGLLNDALGRSEKILAELSPYLSPGTLLQKHAGDLIRSEAERLIGGQNDALRQALIRDLQGIIGIDRPDEPELVNWLSSELTGALDSAQGWAEKQAGGALDMVDHLGRSLPAFAQQEFRQKLEQSADKLIEEARKRLEAKVAGLSNELKAELGSVLDRIGLKVDSAVAAADRPLAGVRKLIARYQEKFRKIVEAAGDAARAKVSATIQIEESRLSSTAMEIEGTFLARSESARSAFRALTRGHFDALLKLFEGAGGDFVLDPARSSLRRFASTTSKLGIELVLFGFGATGNELLTAEAAVLVDGNGQVQVDAKGKLEKRFKGLDAEREITLVSAYSLVMANELANAAPAVERVLGLSVTVGHVDDRLKRTELERFVGSLVNSAFLAPAALTMARQTFDEWTGNAGSNGRLAAALSLKLALDRVSLSKLLELGSGSQNPAISDERSRRIVLASFEALRHRNASERAAIDATLAHLLEGRFRGKTREDVIMDRGRARRELEIVTTGSRIRQVPPEDEAFVDAVDLGFGMRDMIQRLREIYFSTPQTRRDQDPKTWTAEQYRDAEKAAAKSVRRWLQLNNVLFWTDSRVHPRVIAFLDTLLLLAERDPDESLSLTMTRTDDPKTVVLTQFS